MPKFKHKQFEAPTSLGSGYRQASAPRAPGTLSKLVGAFFVPNCLVDESRALRRPYDRGVPKSRPLIAAEWTCFVRP